MKVLLVIDHFGPGGAQRQIVELACGMQRRGHEIEMFVYFPEHGFFRPLLDAHGLSGLDVANYNSPAETVISGPVHEIERAGPIFQNAGAQLYVPLPVSAALTISTVLAMASAWSQYSAIVGVILSTRMEGSFSSLQKAESRFDILRP